MQIDHSMIASPSLRTTNCH